MVTINQLSSSVKNILKEAGIENYSFETRCIFEYILKTSYARLILNPDKEVDNETAEKAEEAAVRRAGGYPLQYITGEWEFFGLPFCVGEGVLIPRQDTETLVENIIETVESVSKPRIIDLCSGSGCVAISVDKSVNCSEVCAVEYSDDALKYLQMNKSINNSSVNIYKGDVLSSEVASKFRNYDAIAANPPYLTADDMSSLQKEVEFEPSMALYGGDDGLVFYRIITKLWKTSLKSGGTMLFEIGMGQENDLKTILESNGFTEIKMHPDLCGIIRVVSGVYRYSNQF